MNRSISCADIDGATSDLCTLVDSNTDTNTQMGTDEIYLYNDSTLHYFNETKLNATIDAKVSASGGGTVTSITAGDGLTGGEITNSGTIEVNFTKLNEEYVATGTKLGNSTEEIQAVYYPTLSTYANESYVTGQGYVTSGVLVSYWNKTDGYSALSTYLNLTMFQSTNTTIDSRLNALEASNNSMDSRMDNMEASNTTQATAISQRALTSDVQSWLSTYLNLTMFQASNTSIDGRLDALEGSSVVNTDTNVTSIQVTGTTTKIMNLEQMGLPNLTASWTDMQGGNSTSEIQAVYYPTLATYVNNSLLSTYANQSYVQASNTTLWTAINNRLINGTKLGNSTNEIQAVYYPTLSTYANTTGFTMSGVINMGGNNISGTGNMSFAINQSRQITANNTCVMIYGATSTLKIC
jgi:hypothetical protein